MAKELTVEKAFQATVSREDKTPKSFTNKAGQTLYVWKVKFVGHADKGWIDVNKQEGNRVNEGDTLYGDITTEQWPDGKPRYGFKAAQRPMDGQAPLTPSKGGSTPTELSAKVDLILEQVEWLVDHFQTEQQAKQIDFSGQQDDEEINLDDLNI